jgi:hypothetical protein
MWQEGKLAKDIAAIMPENERSVMEIESIDSIRAPGGGHDRAGSKLDFNLTYRTRAPSAPDLRVQPRAIEYGIFEIGDRQRQKFRSEKKDLATGVGGWSRL